MHAIRQHRFGPPDVLVYEEVDDPAPGPGQARIAVAAAGCHLVDTTIRAGDVTGPLEPTLPMTPGREVAGVVDAVGPDVDPGWVGRPVVAHLGLASGGYAELAVCAATSLHELPAGTDPAQAVAMVGTGRTTVGILEVAAIGPGDVALVTAAASGIGNLLVQAARSAGATVVGTAGGPAKVAQVDALGADVAVDHDQPGWGEAVAAALDGRAVTVALDGVGGSRGRTALELLGVGGRLVMYGYASGEPTPLSATDLFDRGLTATVGVGPRLLERPGGLRDLEDAALAALADGRLTPLVGTPFPLAEAAAAHAAMEGRATVGKTVLVP